MTSPTDIKLYCTVRPWYMRKRIDHWCSVVPENPNPRVHRTRQASFPTGTVGPRVGIFLSPLNTNDGFYLSYMTAWLLSYMGRVKYSFIPKNDTERTNNNVNDVTERAPRDENGNLTLMAQGAKEDFIFHFATQLMLQSWFPVKKNKVQTTFSRILIPDKNTRELRNNVDPTSKKLEFSRVLDFYALTKNLRKNRGKSNHS